MGVYLYALRPEASLGAFGDEPLALALLHQIDSKLELDPFVVAAAFDFTLGEAKVAVATARGDSPEKIAQQFSVDPVPASARSVQTRCTPS